MPVEVSVILPFYNAEKTIGKAIQSIIGQTFSDFELLLVDNNSTDSSLKIAEKLATRHQQIRIIHEEKQGVAYAMNTGIAKASGQYIARMDADDVAHPERLKQQIGFMRKNPEIGLVGSKVKYVSEMKRTNGFIRFVDWTNSFTSTKEIILNQFIEIPIVNPTLLFRKELADQFGGCTHGDFPEDYDMLLHYLQAGVKMAKVSEPLLEWHDHPGRLTRTDQRYSTEAFFRIKAKYFKLWSEKHNPFHPKIWIWGAGRKARHRARLLKKEGMDICGFIDVVRSKSAMHYSEVPPPGNIFIVPMVAKYGVREQIHEFLTKRAYVNGKDFMMLA